MQTDWFTEVFVLKVSNTAEANIFVLINKKITRVSLLIAMIIFGYAKVVCVIKNTNSSWWITFAVILLTQFFRAFFAPQQALPPADRSMCMVSALFLSFSSCI